MAMTWTEYVIRRRAEGWRWGWQFNEQLKTDPAMQPPVADARMPHRPRDHEPSDLDRPYPILPRQREGADDVSTAADDDER